MKLVALVLLAACSGGGSAAREPQPEPYDLDQHRHGPMLPEGGAEAGPPPDAMLVDLPPAAVGDDLAPPIGASAVSTEHYEAGARAYDLGDFKTAIKELERAYELEPHVEYLYDLAQAYRQIGNVKSALFFYKRYAAITRDDATAIDVTAVIEDLQVILDELESRPEE